MKFPHTLKIIEVVGIYIVFTIAYFLLCGLPETTFGWGEAFGRITMLVAALCVLGIFRTRTGPVYYVMKDGTKVYENTKSEKGTD